MKSFASVKTTVLAACACCCLWAGPAAAGGKAAEYSANLVHIDAAGKVEPAGRIVAAPGKWRMEQLGGEAGAPVVIVRMDKKTQWVLMPEEKIYMESVVKEGDQAAGLGKPGGPTGKVVEKDLGAETVNGYLCRKKEVTSESAFQGRTMKHVTIVWQAEEFDFPLRTRDEDGSVTEMRDIKTGAQPAALFEVPAGFDKMTMPVMPGMPGMPGGLKPGQ